MKKTNQLFLHSLRASLLHQPLTWEGDIIPDDIQHLFQMAHIHHVLPMVYEAVYQCRAVKELDPAILQSYKRQVVLQVSQQMIRTHEFLQLYQQLTDGGVRPLVVKGIICRNMYPQPDHRLSGDEDMLIRPEQFAACHQVMTDYGLAISRMREGRAMTVEEAAQEFEVPYRGEHSPLYIELHQHLFSPDSEAYGDLDRYFAGVHERARRAEIQGTPVWTLGHDDHLFYLICHALKHFLHSGFGIRQVCDIIMYANSYGEEIHWEQLLERCREVRAEYFAAAMFRIGEKYLVFDPQRAGYPACWRDLQVDETALLDDLLSAGIYGNADMTRKHTSNMTLSAVADQKKGTRSGRLSALRQTVFLPREAMARTYPYVQKCSLLLPVAWGSRIIKYLKESAGKADNRAADSIKLGNQRIELLKQYGVIR